MSVNLFEKIAEYRRIAHRASQFLSYRSESDKAIARSSKELPAELSASQGIEKTRVPFYKDKNYLINGFTVLCDV